MSNYFRQCKKCGTYMNQIISYRNGDPYIYWQCPNGCENSSGDSYYTNTTSGYPNTCLRYCRYYNKMCEYAGNLGYCQLTACQYQFLSNYSNCKRYKL